MNLCGICQGFDVRALLLQSAAQRTRASGITDRNLVDAEDYRAPIPYFYRHHTNLVNLKNSAERDCKLCALIWRLWGKTLNKPDFTDEWLDETFQGEIYLGCSGWTKSKQGLPYITVVQHPVSSGDRVLCSFEAFARYDEAPDNGFNLLGRAVYEYSGSNECLSVAAQWLRTCLSEHDSCGRSRDVKVPLPTRVINVGDDSCHPKLLCMDGQSDVFIALSYCWGGISSFVLNETTMSDLKKGVPLPNFPTTIRDAIKISCYLGIKYLWIDALCIQQDSPDDWAAEAAKMRDIYAGAVLTIAAANSPSTNSGIYSKRESSGNHVILQWKRSNSGDRAPQKVFLRPGSELWDNNLHSSPLMGRGWTLQECLLSPRTLSFGSQQMIWECSEYQVDEGGRTTVASQDYRGKGFIQYMIRSGSKQEPYNRWQKLQQLLLSRHVQQEQWWKSYSVRDPYDKWFDILQQFTGRSLTKDTDVLPALSGLAREFQRVTKDVYCAGLWKNDIRCGLVWRRIPIRSKDGTSRFEEKRPSQYLAPSWSWAGILGRQASFDGWRTRETLSKAALSVADILDIHTTPRGPDLFGQVTSGTLVLKSRFCHIPPISAVLWDANTSAPATEEARLSHFEKYILKSFRDDSTMEFEFLQQHKPHDKQRFAILELVRWARGPSSGDPGMDFWVVESSGGGEGEYRRIGMVRIRKVPLPNREDVSEDLYWGRVREKAAYEEVIRGRWKRRIVRIV